MKSKEIDKTTVKTTIRVANKSILSSPGYALLSLVVITIILAYHTQTINNIIGQAVDPITGGNSTCGNGIVEDFEECDDGNNNNTDFCRNDCTVNQCFNACINSSLGDINGNGCMEINDFNILQQHISIGTNALDIPCLDYVNDCVLNESDEMMLTYIRHCDDCTDLDVCQENSHYYCDSVDLLLHPACNLCGCPQGCTCDSENTGSCINCPYCGDGIIEHPEMCDDGNNIDTDSCSNNCTLNNCEELCTGLRGDMNQNGCLDYQDKDIIFNAYINGSNYSDFPCADMDIDCDITPADANIVFQSASEACSDCTHVNQCSIQTPLFCDSESKELINNCSVCGCPGSCTCDPSGECVNCNTVCGNGILEFLESCDDNNNMDGDGCSSVCEIEYGWECFVNQTNSSSNQSNSSNISNATNTSLIPNPSICSQIDLCGNNLLDEGETCDTNQLDSYDCITLGFSGGTLACSELCEFNISMCEFCGDGFCSETEDCGSCSTDCGSCDEDGSSDNGSNNNSQNNSTNSSNNNSNSNNTNENSTEDNSNEAQDQNNNNNQNQNQGGSPNIFKGGGGSSSWISRSGSICGNDFCNFDETCISCPSDCGSCIQETSSQSDDLIDEEVVTEINIESPKNIRVQTPDEIDLKQVFIYKKNNQKDNSINEIEFFLKIINFITIFLMSAILLAFIFNRHYPHLLLNSKLFIYKLLNNTFNNKNKNENIEKNSDIKKNQKKSNNVFEKNISPITKGHLGALDKYVKAARKKGFDNDEIRLALRGAGWSNNAINYALKKHR